MQAQRTRTIGAVLSVTEVMRLSGASYRQLDYWERTGTLVAFQPARGSGTKRRYSPEEARIARVLFLLSEIGRQHTTLRAAVACLRGPAKGRFLIVGSDGQCRTTDGLGTLLGEVCATVIDLDTVDSTLATAA